MPRASKYDSKAHQSILSEGSSPPGGSMNVIMKKMAAATAVVTNSGRVRASPMNMPSKMKAATDTTGSAVTQK